MMPRIGIAVPCRDEAERLPRCLHHLRAAVAAYGGEARIVFALDRCRDRSAAIVSQCPDVEVIAARYDSVGAARAAAAATLLPWAQWLCSTDADSAVPPQWLTIHADAYQAGVDVLQGGVRPDPSELSAAEQAAWETRQASADLATLIYGANLGIRAATYRAVGGFAALPNDEDVDLVARARRGGWLVQQSAAAPVLTSARDEGRAGGGFARYIHDLRAAMRDAGEP